MQTHLRHTGFRAMGTYCEIQIFQASRIMAKRQVSRLIEEVKRLESKYTRYREDSFLSQINRGAGSQTGISIDFETQKLFEYAQRCYEQSDGLFDITAGVLRRAWDFNLKQAPMESDLQSLLSLIGFDRLIWQEDKLILPENMEIDFGGIVKEYAADSLVKLARELGVERGLINLGGDFAAIGSQPENKPWPIGVRSVPFVRQLSRTRMPWVGCSRLSFTTTLPPATSTGVRQSFTRVPTWIHSDLNLGLAWISTWALHGPQPGTCMDLV